MRKAVSFTPTGSWDLHHVTFLRREGFTSTASLATIATTEAATAAADVVYRIPGLLSWCVMREEKGVERERKIEQKKKKNWRDGDTER